MAARRKAELEVTDSHRVIEGERLVLRAVVVGAACGVVLGALGWRHALIHLGSAAVLEIGGFLEAWLAETAAWPGDWVAAAEEADFTAGSSVGHGGRLRCLGHCTICHDEVG